MKFIFENFEQWSDIYISVDGEPFVLVKDSELEINLSKGQHKVKLINKYVKDVTYFLRSIPPVEAAKKFTFVFPGLNYANKTLYYTYIIDVHREKSCVVFKWSYKDELNFFDYNIREFYIETKTKNAWVLKQEIRYFKNKKQKNKFILGQILNLSIGFFIIALVEILYIIYTIYKKNNKPPEDLISTEAPPVLVISISIVILIAIIALFFFYIEKLFKAMKEDERFLVDDKKMEQRDDSPVPKRKN